MVTENTQSCEIKMNEINEEIDLELILLENEYSLSFIIQKLTLPDKNYNDLLISVTFHENVVKLQKKEEVGLKKGGKATKATPKAQSKRAGKTGEASGQEIVEEPFLKGFELTLHQSPAELAETLKFNPIMFHVMRGDESLGIIDFQFMKYF